MRLDVEVKKLEAKEEIADIQTWNTHLDTKLDEADNEVGKARKWLDDRKKVTEVLAQEEKMRFEEKLHKTKLEFQTELQASQRSQHPHVQAQTSTKLISFHSLVKRISEFGEKLTYCMQALQTLKKLEQVNGMVSMTLDKLPAIRGDLARTDPNWESWNAILGSGSTVDKTKASGYNASRTRTRANTQTISTPKQVLSCA
ncbi:hypothetical protein OS493_036129 [Desmophyllum pertusum]|uniref:Uncharacterized protein n=1 Tax=Desmophyllum pertusum TaxID=174260 RepID=A0A9W9Y7G0_9CNID|nr:hypothetical protein OS493_036129 [Desmophyllum pertusum]